MRFLSSQVVADPSQLASVISDDRLVRAVPKVVPRAAAIDLAKFGLLLIEVIGLACAVKRFEIESTAFFEIMIIATFGFAIQYFLPISARVGFFLFLSLASIASVFGLVSGMWLIVLGVGLVAILHSPISIAARVGLLALVGAVLAALRAGWAPVPWSPAIWPILGSMFMFRIIVYAYDLKHGQAPASWTQRLAYFFMFPNVCFPLFPVVDSRAFTRTWFDGDRHQIYQTGVEWILRGLVQLILYRIVYLRLAIDPYDVANCTDLIHYFVWLFLLYLRVSGQFHVIAGILHLFGFNLPETHHMYYLASSFTDFWRRINIYWKDFMMKVFYYPAFFWLRKFGTTFALVVATIYVFAWTWALHAYQLFWIRGSYTFTWNDPLFWTILCGLVTINALAEAKFGRRRALTGESRDWRARAVLALKTLATFTVICVLWGFWSSESLEFWFSLWPAALVMPAPAQLATFALVAAGVLLCLASLLAWNTWIAPLINRRFEWRVGLVLAELFLLNAVSITAICVRLGPVAPLVELVRFGGLNNTEMGLLERGYYEDLLTVDRFNGELASLYMKRPAEWAASLDELGLSQPAEGLPYQLKPNTEAVFKGALLRTNRWGMHDQDYPQHKPPGSFRIALLGASHVMGTGILADQTLDAVLEHRLNRSATATGQRFEVLNFAVYGYYPVHQIQLLENRVLAMEPDVMLYVGHPGDAARAVHYLAELVQTGADLPQPFLADIVRRAGANSDLPPRLIHRRLAPYGEEILARTYERLVKSCKVRGVQPVFVLLPILWKSSADAPVAREAELAASAGFVVFNLQDVYRGRDCESLWIAEWDAHPNAQGHRLIAERLYELIQQSRETLLSGL